MIGAKDMLKINKSELWGFIPPNVHETLEKVHIDHMEKCKNLEDSLEELENDHKALVEELERSKAERIATYIRHTLQMQVTEVEVLQEKIQIRKTKNELLRAELAKFREREPVIKRDPESRGLAVSNLDDPVQASHEQGTKVTSLQQSIKRKKAEAVNLTSPLDELSQQYKGDLYSLLGQSEDSMEQVSATATDQPAAEMLNELSPKMESSVPSDRKKSTHLSEEIIALRSQYIVGKIVGKSVYDSNGRSIIDKHAMITTEIIEAAERENKLSELIANMIIKIDGDFSEP